MVLSVRDYGNFCATRTLVRDEKACDGPSAGKCLRCATRFYGPVKGSVAVASVAASRKLLTRRLAAVHSISTYVHDVAGRWLIDGRPLPNRVILNWRDEQESTEVDAAALSTLPTQPYILFVGGIRRVKGVGHLFEAYERLHGAPPLVLIGDRAPDRFAEVPVGATILRDVTHATVMVAWQRALFGVAPSVWPEPLGNVVHEGLSAGVPMVGTRPGGHEDMIEEGVNGLLVPAGDVAALSSAMQKLVDDTDLRRRLASGAVESAARFKTLTSFEDFEALLISTALART
jgi:glycosyltransferase involved in cell wall biosynthesis